MAQKCATAAKEPEAQWRQVLWSPAFQLITRNMCDGEVVTSVEACPSLVQLRGLVALLERNADTPYSFMEQQAGLAKLELHAWIATLK